MSNPVQDKVPHSFTQDSQKKRDRKLIDKNDEKNKVVFKNLIHWS